MILVAFRLSSVVYVIVTKIAGIWQILLAFYWFVHFALIYAKTKRGKLEFYFFFTGADLQFLTRQ